MVNKKNNKMDGLAVFKGVVAVALFLIILGFAMVGVAHIVDNYSTDDTPQIAMESIDGVFNEEGLVSSWGSCFDTCVSWYDLYGDVELIKPCMVSLVESCMEQYSEEQCSEIDPRAYCTANNPSTLPEYESSCMVMCSGVRT